MKKEASSSVATHLALMLSFLVLTLTTRSQNTDKVSTPLPDNINKIVSVSCMPCHSSSGGMLSRMKLNFSVWFSYSVEKQAEKAKKMYKKVSKNDMPPKSARENNPGIIPTSEQIDVIKKWADSLKAEK
jgi:hypothetical protein